VGVCWLGGVFSWGGGWVGFFFLVGWVGVCVGLVVFGLGVCLWCAFSDSFPPACYSPGNELDQLHFHGSLKVPCPLPDPLFLGLLNTPDFRKRHPVLLRQSRHPFATRPSSRQYQIATNFFWLHPTCEVTLAFSRPLSLPQSLTILRETSV